MSANEGKNDEAWLDDVLMKGLAPDGAAAHIDDAGFTDGVMAKLPARKKRRLRRRDVAIGVSALVAGATGALAVVGGSAFELSVEALRANPTSALALVVVVGLGLWGAFASAEA